MRFAGMIGQHGFVSSERLVPPGFPAPPFQAVYRYSEKGTQPGRPLFQLGTGLFSAHITPPYRRWSDFRPFIERGVSALLAARDSRESSAPFIHSLVRYLDCFTNHYTADLSPRQFIEDKLGIQLSLPKAIESRAKAGADIVPSLKLVIPLENGCSMNISLGKGKIDTKLGVVMDSSVACARPLEPSLKGVMAFLDEAHTIASECFVEITAALHEQMEIEQ